jgi:hypothetical protein
MQTALRMETTVLPGNRVEVSDPGLPEGAQVEVIVVLPREAAHTRRMSMIELLEKLPPGPRAFDTWEEYERFLQEEKDSWDR